MTHTEDLSNIEWKQSSDEGKKTRNSRRRDVKKLTASDEQVNDLDVGMRQIKSFFPNNLRKIRSKIREVFDEDEDEEDEINTALFLHMNNEEYSSSLLDGLKEEEKRKLQEDQTLKNQSMQQSAGKMEAIINLNNKLQKSGVKKLSEDVVNVNMLRVETDQQTFVNTAKQHLAKSEKIKTTDISNYDETNNLIKGLNKIKKVSLLDEVIDGSKVEKLDAKELAALGKESNDKKAAKTIYYKTGRKNKKTDNLTPEEKKKLQQKIEKTLSENKQYDENSR